MAAELKSVSLANKYYCPSCHRTFKKNEVWFNNWISKWCPYCFKKEESPGYCKLEVIKNDNVI